MNASIDFLYFIPAEVMSGKYTRGNRFTYSSLNGTAPSDGNLFGEFTAGASELLDGLDEIVILYNFA